YGQGVADKVQAELSRALLRVQWEALAAETARTLSPDLAKLSDDELTGTAEEEVAAQRRERSGARPRR
ncbi:MAG: hypothetical protein HY560_10790, partial [Gemmatimonadetes bacterium]|nr:hypothetical protein [Gemmatimonadota bacterium]